MLQEVWNTPRLKAYIAWAKASFAPVALPEAEAVLLWYYGTRRRMAGSSAARATIRMLQGLLRLAQVGAHPTSILKAKSHLCIWAAGSCLVICFIL